MHGMTISATDVRFDEATMWVSLSDGRTLGVPLAWFPEADGGGTGGARGMDGAAGGPALGKRWTRTSRWRWLLAGRGDARGVGRVGVRPGGARDERAPSNSVTAVPSAPTAVVSNT